MNICIYSPYIPRHTGGGEKYLFDVARVLSQRHQVSLAVSQPGAAPFSQSFVDEVTDRYQRFLGRSLGTIQWIPTPIGTSEKWWRKLLWTKQFDLMYYATDGSLFFSLAGRNILHVQIPFQEPKSSLIDRLKLHNWSIRNCNSQFTKQVVEQAWQTSIPTVHYPMIDVPEPLTEAQLRHKEPIILNVGRFFRHLHSKRQDVLIETFAELRRSQPQFSKGWKLVLIGAAEDQQFAKEVADKAAGLPVEIYHDVSRTELLAWYRRATIYWHAAGFGINQRQHPEKVEHFGISTAEAMAHGCVPVVLAKGGQPEVVGSQLAECLWQTPQQCIDKTIWLLRQPPVRWELAQAAMTQAAHFGPAQFEKKLWQMVEGKG